MKVIKAIIVYYLYQKLHNKEQKQQLKHTFFIAKNLITPALVCSYSNGILNKEGKPHICFSYCQYICTVTVIVQPCTDCT